MTELADTIPHYSANPEEPVLFYGGPLSSFAERRMRISAGYQGASNHDFCDYSCREDFYQSAKAKNRADHDWVLGNMLDTWEVKARGQQVDLRDDWEWQSPDLPGIKYTVMLRYIWAELNAYPSLAVQLKATGDRLIAEDSPSDFVWGIRNGGQNLLGLAWMHAREALYNDEHYANPNSEIPLLLQDRGWIRDTMTFDQVFQAKYDGA